MRRNVYFNDTEDEWIKKQERGYVRGLVQKDMRKPSSKKADLIVEDEILRPRDTHASSFVKDPVQKAREVVSQLPRRSSGKNINPNDQCKKCGQMKVLGKCPGCGK